MKPRAPLFNDLAGNRRRRIGVGELAVEELYVSALPVAHDHVPRPALEPAALECRECSDRPVLDLKQRGGGILAVEYGIGRVGESRWGGIVAGVSAAHDDVLGAAADRPLVGARIRPRLQPDLLAAYRAARRRVCDRRRRGPRSSIRGIGRVKRRENDANGAELPCRLPSGVCAGASHSYFGKSTFPFVREIAGIRDRVVAPFRERDATAFHDWIWRRIAVSAVWVVRRHVEIKTAGNGITDGKRENHRAASAASASGIGDDAAATAAATETVVAVHAFPVCPDDELCARAGVGASFAAIDPRCVVLAATGATTGTVDF